MRSFAMSVMKVKRDKRHDYYYCVRVTINDENHLQTLISQTEILYAREK